MHVTLAGAFAVDTGREAMHVYLAMGMRRAGATLSLRPTYVKLRGCPPEFVQIYAQSAPPGDGPVVHSSWTGEDLGGFDGSALYLRAMYEASGLPRGWTTAINRTSGVIVPSTFVADTFRAAGVTAPVWVVPDGVDPCVYQYSPPAPHDGITTLVVAGLWDPTTAADRKHLPAAIRAWQLAFGADPSARLVLKLRWPAGGRHRIPSADGSIAADRRIRIVTEVEHALGIAHWYEQADVLLALGSEGFGLPLVEAMAVGRPVVALASEGQKDVCDQAGDLVLSVLPAGFEPHRHQGGEQCGVRGYPSPAEVASKLRWVADHRDEAADMGRAASSWVRSNRNVWDYGPSVLGVLSGDRG
jgi:glycosyltransferase involved in cell wall biosynthesis